MPFDGPLLRRLRERDGRSQAWVAHEVGVTAQVVSSWESGEYAPTAEHLRALAEYFGVTMERFFKETKK